MKDPKFYPSTYTIDYCRRLFERLDGKLNTEGSSASLCLIGGHLTNSRGGDLRRRASRGGRSPQTNPIMGRV